MSDDIVMEARKVWWEIVESDRGECRLMGIVRELADEVERLRKALDVIKSATDADNAESYRSDDREGCLDFVFAEASRSLSTQADGGGK